MAASKSFAAVGKGSTADFFATATGASAAGASAFTGFCVVASAAIFSALVAGSAAAGASNPLVGAPLGLSFWLRLFLLRMEVVLGDFAFAMLGYSLQVPR